MKSKTKSSSKSTSPAEKPEVKDESTKEAPATVTPVAEEVETGEVESAKALAIATSETPARRELTEDELVWKVREWARQQEAGFQNYAPSLDEYKAAGYNAANYPPGFAQQRQLTDEWHVAKKVQVKELAGKPPPGVVKREPQLTILDRMHADAAKGRSQNDRSAGDPQTCRG